jgi:hypothetical protein
MKKVFIVMVAVFLLSMVFHAYAQPASQEAGTTIVKGQVVDFDWVAGKLIIRTSDFGNPDEIIVWVTSDTKIIKGSETIFFSDVLQGDQVSVLCVSPSFSGVKALQIMVNE